MRGADEPRDVVELDGQSLTLEQLVAIARRSADLALSASALARVRESRQTIEHLIDSGTPVYGVTTGFGALQDHVVSREQLESLQENIILSHSAGVGQEMPHDAVRAMIALRVNCFARGYSGVRPELAQALIALVNNGIVPVVPIQGSVGSSGDLAPLAHLASVLIGKGYAYYHGTRYTGAEALRMVGLDAQKLQAKEGLALTNGTQFMTAIGALALADALNLAKCADVALSLTLEALKGRSAAFREEISLVRAHDGHAQVGGNVRALVAGSQLVDRDDDDTAGKLQDAYSLRCAPQVHGASRCAFDYVGRILAIEMNSVNDNPIIFSADASVCSAGNFHGQPIALALDHLALATAELGNISERRCARLLDQRDNRGLPAFLVSDGGLNTGLMIVQYTAAALASENKSLAHPASVDSIPTSANQEDHNSMGSIAARHARAVVDNVLNIIAIELLCACQALDFRLREGLMPGAGSRAVFDAIRSVVSRMDRDREIHGDIRAVAELVASGTVAAAADQAIGGLR